MPKTRKPRRQDRRLWLERLEQRALLATIQVTTLEDAGMGSLRAAIAAANLDTAEDTIVFTGAARGGTINLTTIAGSSFGPNAFEITSPITIQGSGETIQRQEQAAAFRLFFVNTTGLLIVRDLTLRNGLAQGGRGGTNFGDDGGGGGGGLGAGGAVYVRGVFEATGVLFIENVALGGEGGAGADRIGIDSGGGGGGGGMGGNGGVVVDGNPTNGFDGGAGGGGTFSTGLSGVSTNGGSGGGLTGGQGGATSVNGAAGGLFGGGGGGGDDAAGGNGGIGGGGGGSGEDDGSDDAEPGGNGGFGGGGGGGGEDNNGGNGGFGGGGGGGSRDGDTPSAAGGLGGIGAGAGGSPGTSFGSGGGGGGAGIGGAIFADGVDSNRGHGVLIVNSTFSGNQAIGGPGGLGTNATMNGQPGFGLGGAVANVGGGSPGNAYGRVRFFNSTLTLNTADQARGVYAVAAGNIADTTFINTIVGQADTDFTDVEFATVVGQNFIRHSNSIVRGDAGISISTADPQLGPLANHGGPTRTHLPALASPAINAGINNMGQLISTPSADQRGAPFARIADGTIDIGAVERQTLVVDTNTDVVDGNYLPGNFSLREAIALANAIPGANTITFAPTLGDITLTTGQLELSDTTGTTSISGPSHGTQVVQRSTAAGTPHFRVFKIFDGASAEISGLTIARGRAEFGGGILVDGHLGLSQSAIRDNIADFSGGGISAQLAGSSLHLFDSTIERNSAALGTGGGLHLANTNAFLQNTTVTGNQGVFGGGISIIESDFTGIHLTVTSNRLTTNTANAQGGIYAQDSVKLVLHNSVVAGNFGEISGVTTGDIGGNATFSGSSSHNLIGDPATAGGIVHGANGNIVGKDHDNNANTPRVLWPIAEILNTTLANNGGPTLTHALVAGSPAINAGVALAITPQSVTSSTATSDFYPARQLIDNSGLSGTVNANNVVTVMHGAASSGTTAWVTDSPSADYYSSRPAPELTFQLGGDYALTDLAIWGYDFFGNGPDDNNEAKSYQVQFSTDNGATFGNPVTVTSSSRLGPSGAKLSLGGTFTANAVKLTITDNFFGAAGGGGGDRVGLGEVKFIGRPASDQRGVPFSRNAGGAVDIGAFESQALALVVDQPLDENDGNYAPGDLSLREAVALANANPGADSVTFAGALRGQTLTLTQGRLHVTGSLNITGPGASLLSISGNNVSQIFYIDGQTDGAGVITIQDVTLTQGRALGGGAILDGIPSAQFGGALLNNRANVTLRRVAITNSSASGSGGGLYNWQGGSTLTLIDSTVSGNNSTFGAGGIFNWTASSLTLLNSTVSGNTANGFAGGIANSSGSLVLVNATIIGNRAVTGSGGGLDASGTEQLTNTLLAGNFVGGSGTTPSDISGAINAAANSLIGNPSTAGSITHGANGNIVGKDHDNNASTARVIWPIAEILNTTLANNGGPTLTHALVLGSPAINAGSNASLPAGTINDQRGQPRISAVTVDIGAFEFFAHQNPRNRFDVDDDGAVAPIDALLVINELNAAGSRALPPLAPGARPTFYFDVSGDDFISPLDALLVINFLNAGGQGESPAALATDEVWADDGEFESGWQRSPTLTDAELAILWDMLDVDQTLRSFAQATLSRASRL